MTFARFVAGGFGTGFAPLAAGTVASIAAVISGAALMTLSTWAVAAAALIATVGGYQAIRHAEVRGDPGWVVIDEFAGQWLTLLALSRISITGLILSFLLFRIFDITKLGPVGWADRRHDAFGIMADDVIAGAIAAALLLALRLLWPRLGI